METNDLTVVIVTFKSEEVIFSCLDSIPSNIKVIVVENSNNTKFKEELEEKYKNVNCILAGENKGYAVSNNTGLRKVNTKFALILNPDTELKKDTIQHFFKTIDLVPEFWLIGPGNNQVKAKNFDDNGLLEVDNLKGFAIFFNISKFKKIFFDENFFLYFEEIDLCKDLKRRGGKIYLDKKIVVDHLGAKSVKRNNNLEYEKNRNWHWMWSTFYFHKKYKGFVIALLIILPKIFSSLIKILYYQIIFNKENRNIFISRLNGIVNSILGKKSWYRPSLD